MLQPPSGDFVASLGYALATRLLEGSWANVRWDTVGAEMNARVR